MSVDQLHSSSCIRAHQDPDPDPDPDPNGRSHCYSYYTAIHTYHTYYTYYTRYTSGTYYTYCTNRTCGAYHMSRAFWTLPVLTILTVLAMQVSLQQEIFPRKKIRNRLAKLFKRLQQRSR